MTPAGGGRGGGGEAARGVAFVQRMKQAAQQTQNKENTQNGRDSSSSGQQGKAEYVAAYDPAVDATVVYRRQVVYHLPHLALRPVQPRVAGVPVPTLSPTTRVDTMSLLVEMNNLLRFAQLQKEATSKRKRPPEPLHTVQGLAGDESTEQESKKKKKRRGIEEPECAEPSVQGETLAEPIRMH